MTVSVIIPAYVPNEKLLEVTRRCLDSLKVTAEGYELVVIDNGSIRLACQYLKRPADLYLRYDEPIGYARAANIGLAVAGFDWLCVVNTDIEFQREGWLETFKEDYAGTPGGILSAQDEGREGIVYDESWFSCWITQREVVQRVGYFDEAMGFRFHDQDYAIRVKQAGLEVMRTGNVPVGHINSATYNTMGRNEDPAEREMMRRKWGCDLFADWIRSAVV
jgi:GT2 family glycosyltransferase